MELVLGIDGGGTKTVALLAAADRADVLGRGESGPSNVLAVGPKQARANLSAAIRQCFQHAQRDVEPVAAACLALAGSDRAEVQQQIVRWNEQDGWARRLHLVHDAEAVLAAGTHAGSGIVLIAGTGSLAWGRAASGRTSRVGGWGPLLGDEGSGYWIARRALQYVMQQHDGRGAKTVLSDRLLGALSLASAKQLAAWAAERPWDRACWASLAPLVTTAAEQGDPVARQIAEEAAAELARMVSALARQLQLESHPYALILAGGVLVRCSLVRDLVYSQLTDCRPATMQVVADPVHGAVALARQLLA